MHLEGNGRCVPLRYQEKKKPSLGVPVLSVLSAQFRLLVTALFQSLVYVW